MRCLRLWYFFSQWKFLSHSMYKTCTARKMQHEKRREEQIDAHKIAKCSSFISRLEKRKAQVKDVLLLRTRTSQQEMNCRNAKQDWRKERSKKPLFCFIDARARAHGRWCEHFHCHAVCFPRGKMLSNVPSIFSIKTWTELNGFNVTFAWLSFCRFLHSMLLLPNTFTLCLSNRFAFHRWWQSIE